MVKQAIVVPKNIPSYGEQMTITIDGEEKRVTITHKDPTYSNLFSARMPDGTILKFHKGRKSTSEPISWKIVKEAA